jgi:hypothetical protein
MRFDVEKLKQLLQQVFQNLLLLAHTEKRFCSRKTLIPDKQASQQRTVAIKIRLTEDALGMFDQ